MQTMCVIYFSSFNQMLPFTGSSNCSDGTIRLANGNSEREERVEICYNRVWGTVCDYGWDEVDASVVCQQMGFTYQRALPTNNSHFGAGEGPILLENVRCNQSHSNLSQCVDYFKHIGTVRRCMHTAGVICEDMTTNTSTELVPTTDQTTSASPHDTTTNISHESTYTSHDTNSSTDQTTSASPQAHDTTTNISHESTYTSHDTNSSTASEHVGTGSSISPIIYGVMSVGVLVIIGVIAAVAIMIIVVVVMRKRAGQMENR